jgi:hypothetical protein
MVRIVAPSNTPMGMKRRTDSVPTRPPCAVPDGPRRTPWQQIGTGIRMNVRWVGWRAEQHVVMRSAARIARDRAFRASQQSAASRQRPGLSGLCARIGEFTRQTRPAIGAASTDRGPSKLAGRGFAFARFNKLAGTEKSIPFSASASCSGIDERCWPLTLPYHQAALPQPQ